MATCQWQTGQAFRGQWCSCLTAPSTGTSDACLTQGLHDACGYCAMHSACRTRHVLSTLAGTLTPDALGWRGYISGNLGQLTPKKSFSWAATSPTVSQMATLVQGRSTIHFRSALPPVSETMSSTPRPSDSSNAAAPADAVIRGMHRLRLGLTPACGCAGQLLLAH